jgi:hypothetical protein
VAAALRGGLLAVAAPGRGVATKTPGQQQAKEQRTGRCAASAPAHPVAVALVPIQKEQARKEAANTSTSMSTTANLNSTARSPTSSADCAPASGTPQAAGASALAVGRRWRAGRGGCIRSATGSTPSSNARRRPRPCSTSRAATPRSASAHTGRCRSPARPAGGGARPLRQRAAVSRR